MCKALPKRNPKEFWPVQILENLGNVVVMVQTAESGTKRNQVTWGLFWYSS